MKMLLLFTKILDRLSPRLAVQFAARLFATPQRIPRPTHELELIKAATPIEFKCGLKGHQFGTQGDPILLMHGWEGRGSQLAYFAEPLVQKGYRVFAVDGPGHGESPGKQTTPVHFARFIMSLAEELGPLKALIAHSFGAGSAVLAAHDGTQVEKLVLVAGPDRYAKVVDHFCNQIGLRPKTRDLFFNEITQRVGMTPEALQISRLAQRLTAKILLVHDQGDKAVPFEASENIHKANPGSQLFATQGLGHRRILKDPAVLKKVAEFIHETTSATNSI